MKYKDYKTVFLLTFYLFLFGCEGNSQSSSKIKTILPKTDILDSLLQSDRGIELLSHYLNNPDYAFQIIYTKVNRDSFHQVDLEKFEFQVNDEKYFYPASTVKLPLTLLALEKLNHLGLSRDTELTVDATISGGTSVTGDWTSANQKASIGHYIRKIFIVSDNDASNRLYDFLGREYIHQTLSKKGYDNVQIVHRLGIPKEQHEAEVNKFTNEVSFFQDGQLQYQQPAMKDITTYNFSEKPSDFLYSNHLPLRTLHQLLSTILFPENFLDSIQFDLRTSDRKFLLQCMATLPRESKYPNYLSLLKTGEYPPDSYRKYLLFANEVQIPDNFRIFSKVGMGFNHLTDVAYVVDFKNGVEFILTATISVPNNQYNDGLTFLKNLGQLIYEYELSRERKFEPDFGMLKELKFE